MKNPFLKTPKGQHGKNIEIRNLRHSWSKYGRLNLGTEKMPDNIWFCQVCHTEQPRGIEPYLFPLSDREYLRICPICEHAKSKNNVIAYETLIIIRRKLNTRENFSEF